MVLVANLFCDRSGLIADLGGCAASGAYLRQDHSWTRHSELPTQVDEAAKSPLNETFVANAKNFGDHNVDCVLIPTRHEPCLRLAPIAPSSGDLSM